MIADTLDRIAVQAAVLLALRDVTRADVVWPGAELSELGAGPATMAKVARVLERDLHRHVEPATLAPSVTGIIDVLSRPAETRAPV